MSKTLASDIALAILIDADNASSTLVNPLFAEVAKLGRATVRRIYGDWTTPNLVGWKETLLDHSIQPIQQFRNRAGKNATDSALIIDAMDLLHTGHLDGFCIVSSDSDFTRLAARLRESDKRVYGFGEQKTPRAFTSACDRFIYLNRASEPEKKSSPPKDTTKPQGDGTQSEHAESSGSSLRKNADELQADAMFVDLVSKAVDVTRRDNGWSNLTEVGGILSETESGFDSRTYGYKRLSDLLEASTLFEVDRSGKAFKTRRANRT